MSQPSSSAQSASSAHLPVLVREYEASRFMADDERWIGFSDILRILRVRRRAILAAAGAVVALAALAVFLITPLYIGTALVMVDEQQSHVVDDPSVLSGVPSGPSSIASQVQILKSRALAAQVVDKLKLADDPEFGGKGTGLAGAFLDAASGLAAALGTGDTDADSKAAGLNPRQRLREKTIDKFQKQLDIYSLGHSTVIEADFRSSSAAKAARIANALADTYVRNQIDAKANAAQGASKWLSDRVDRLASQASAADAAVQQYKVDNGLMDTSTGTSMSDQQLGDLTSQLILAEGNRAEAEARLARVRQLVKSGESANVTEVVDSALITQLREQEATLLQQKADLASRYGSLHPKMQVVDAQLRELKRKIGEEVDRVAGTVSNNVSVAAAHVGALKREMSTLTAKTNIQNQARVKLGELQAKATSAHALYQAYLDRLKQTQQQQSLKIPDVHVASPASVPLKPVYPKTLTIMAASVPVGLILGFLIALMSDRLCNGFRSPAEVEAALGLPVLANVPELGSHGRALKNVAIEIVKKPQSRFSEAIRGLELGLSCRGNETDGGKAILVTSALPGEGKTTTAVSLARRLATAGYRVVIVDADLRRPKVSVALGLRKFSHGLTDYLEKRCSLDEALSPDPHSPLVALAASHTANASDMIAAPEMGALIGRLREISDFVVIDTPPVLAVHDAKLLASQADGALFVVRWEKTPREAVTSAVKSLREFGASLFGAALVRTNVKQYQYYTYGYNGIPALSGYYDN